MPLVRGHHSFDNHFTQIPNAWLRDKRISLGAKGLLAQLMSHNPGWSISQQSLAYDNGVGKDAVRTLINELMVAGYLLRSEDRERDESGRLGGFIYTTTDPNSEENTGKDTTAAKPTQAEPTLDNPPHKKNIIKEQKIKELNPQNKFEDEFNEFWDVYPKKVDKAPAFKAFMKAADKHGARTIIDGASRFANDPNLPFDKTFIKYPATWLNALGWLEGPLPERERTKEELEALRVAQSRKKADADKAYTDKLLAEMKEAENRVKVDPPRICEHGRVAVICMECSRLKVRPNR